ncbi:hypothetical protein VTO58DRAFT_108947 [Aureobasidium pullulans]|uniref:Uncharacterized protein n=1 Tax=Aureobasidium pullulans TaxID=5580 RepID=A0A4S9XEY0_AURPU|nr:hypothetical protein JADG_005826 [Aureobasidium pullulans]THW70843.1 hypothetical protein D6D25_00396 [Aureobasidium pullulans]THZ04763.1 hypothetical protein D6C95_03158 [Aureobasidium pullulans]THZ77367.1 hypothetical protein D6C85_01717 [Aureobasidium pullulans]
MAPSASVNVPTNTKIKEQDVNNKLQLYGIFSAFSNGKVPSNKQIDVAMNSALASRPLSNPSKKLSTEGQKLVGDLREVVEQAKLLLLTKNEGNLLQDFIWQTQQISGGNAGTPNAPVDKETAKQHGNEALDGLRTLGTLILSNGQFRKLLSDASILFRDMAGDAAQKAANKVNPSEDELNQIDKPAEDNTWHDVPDLSKDNLKNQARSKYNEQKPFNKQEAKGALGDAAQAAHPSGSRDPAHAAELAARDQQQGTNSGVDAGKGLQQGADQLHQTARENIPDETQEKARNARERTTNYMKDKIPQERRDQGIYRLKKMVAEIQGHQDYQQAIDTLLRLAEQYSGHTKNLANQSQGTVKGAHKDDSLQMAEADLKTLIERFANGTSLDDMFDSINVIYRDADSDPELKGWFTHMNKYIRKCLKEQGYVLQDSSTEEWNKLYDQGEFLLRDRYRNHTDRIADEFKFYIDQFNQDRQNVAFGDAVQKLFLDLGQDENGQAQFKPHLIKDLTEVILPGLFESIRYVPIPRIEYSDPMMDAIVENLVLEGDNLAPNVMEFGSDNYWRWGRKSITSKNKNKVMLSVSGVQCDLRDVSYYIKKKEGFPSITDKGVMDIFLGGTGLSFKVAMETADKTDSKHFFKVNSVHVDIKNINIKLKQSNHKLLFNMFKPLLLKVMRPAIQKVAETQIRNNIHQLDEMLFAIHQEAKKAEAQARNNPDPENIQNIYQRYATAAQQKFTKGKQKKDEVAADKKVNMAVTQHDSIFKNISLPGGISTKATEYKELAAKGDKWESPIFSIGSARETSNLPKMAAISRKPHRVNQEGVRGPNNLGTDQYGSGFNGSSETGPSGGLSSSGNTGYGSQSGYGSQGSTGYHGGSNTAGLTGQVPVRGGNTTGTGYDQNTTNTTGYHQGSSHYAAGEGPMGTTRESTGAGNFGGEVDRAFHDATTGTATGTTGTTGTTGAVQGDETQHTFFGKNNPVFQGRV